MTNTSKGVIPVVYIVVIALGGAALLVPSWHLPAFLQKKPPVAQLSQAEVDLAKSKADLSAAQAKLDAARAAETQKTHEQIVYSQQMVAGVPVALAKAPQIPEVVLASQLAQRAQVGLAAAIGDLPPDKQAEITAIVGQALSAKQAEVDAAKAALAVKDAELAQTTQAKKALEASIPPLQQAVVTARADVAVKDATVAEKTQEVASWAEKKAASDAKAGSLDAYAGNLVRILLAIGILYILVHVCLPSLAQEFPTSSWLVGINKVTKSLTSAHQ